MKANSLRINLAPGRYVLAVSGGVDSVVLLALMRKNFLKTDLVVGHVQHGIRGRESEKDAEFVKNLAAEYGLLYEQFNAELGTKASEAGARTARYNFLSGLAKKHRATLVTAHHQDDVIETIIINLIRGTGWRGLAALRSETNCRRPFLNFTKKEIINYAEAHKLAWREDKTNQDPKYLRNYVRLSILPGVGEQDKNKLLALHHQQVELMHEVSKEVIKHQPFKIISDHSLEILRYSYIMWPTAVALECLQSAIRHLSGPGLEQSQLLAALIFIKTAKHNKKWQPRGDIIMISNRDRMIVERK